MKFTKLWIGVIFITSRLIAQSNPYIEEGSVGKIKHPSINNTIEEGFRYPYYPISNWIGKKFIFLPQSKKLQVYGYQTLEPRTAIGDMEKLPYSNHVGKIVTVKDVYSDNAIKLVRCFIEETGEEFIAKAYSDNLMGLALLDDLDSSRNHWTGKALWYKKGKLTSYDADAEKFPEVKIKKFSQVRVEKVTAGWYSFKPIRFIISDSGGNLGFEDINVSGTNVPDNLKKNSLFGDFFFEQDPHEMYDWDDKTWDAIENGKVFIGMTKEQGILSWGKPKDINKTLTASGREEQWVYKSGSYLYFTNDVLTSIQN